MERFSAYEYLGFVVPGGLVCVVAFYGGYGWPYDEPGATYLVGIVAAAFVVGHLVAGLANLVCGLAWRRLPWHEPDSYEGAFKKGQYLEGRTEADVLATFKERVGDHRDLNRSFKAAAKIMHVEGRANRLDVFNQQIGFYRNTATACGICLLLVVGYEVQAATIAPLPAPIWAPVFIVSVLVFTRRYRRFWKLYGREVWLDVSTVRFGQAGDTGGPAAQG